MYWQFLAITIQSNLIDWNGFEFEQCFGLLLDHSQRFSSLFFSSVRLFVGVTDWQPADNKPFNWLRLFTLSQSNSKANTYFEYLKTFLGWFFTFNTAFEQTNYKKKIQCKRKLIDLNWYSESVFNEAIKLIDLLNGH